MANIILVGNGNNLDAALDTTEKTLTITGLNAFDLVLTSLSSIWDVTADKAIPLTYLSNCAMTRDDGKPVYTYTFTQDFPSGVVNSDELEVYLDVPKQFMDYLALQKLATA